jgi:hypothetical protein
MTVLAEAELRLGVDGVGLAADALVGGSTGGAGSTHGGGLRREPLPPGPPARARRVRRSWRWTSMGET